MTQTTLDYANSLAEEIEKLEKELEDIEFMLNNSHRVTMNYNANRYELIGGGENIVIKLADRPEVIVFLKTITEKKLQTLKNEFAKL